MPPILICCVISNGKIFAWDNPPETGHPGEDYNCRCWAEDYVAGESEYAYQVINNIYDHSPQWTNFDFIRHFYFGNGRGVMLSETGHLRGVIDYYFYHSQKEGKRIYERINNQIINKARTHNGDNFTYYFYDSYGFDDYLFVFGDGVISGLFSGSAHHENGVLNIEGEIEYFYDDVFTDPVDIRERLRRTSTPEEAFWLERVATDFAGTFFPIKDSWKTTFKANAHFNPRISIYH